MVRTVSLFVLLTAFVAVCMAAPPVVNPSNPEPAVGLKLLTPAANETWAAGTTQMVNWTLTSPQIPDSIVIVLMEKGMKNVRLAAIVKESSNKWEWTKVGPISASAILQVKAYFPAKVVLKDQHSFVIAKTANGGITTDNIPVSQPVVVKGPSDAVAIDAVPPSKPMPAMNVVVLSPNGGEKFDVGSPVVLKWDAKFPDVTAQPLTFLLTLSRDGGKTYTEKLAGDLKSSVREFKWVVKGPGSNMCRVKVSLNGMVEPVVIEDASDGDFSVAALPIDKPTNSGVHN